MLAWRWESIGLLLIFINIVLGGIIDYDDAELPPWNYESIRFGVYSFDDTPTGNNIPTVEFNITLTAKHQNQTGQFYILLFPSREKYFADFALMHLHAVKTNRLVRCPDLRTDEQYKLSTSPALIYRQIPIGKPQANSFVFAHVHETFTIEESSMWYMYFFHCKEGYVEYPVEIEGHLTWKNPFGYIDGKYLPNIMFYGCAGLLYATTCLVWALICFINRTNLLGLHIWSLIILFLAAVECGIMFYAEEISNQKGETELSLVVLFSIFGVMKHTLARVIGLLLTLGFSIIRSSVSRGTKVFLTGICVGYFAASLAYRIVDIAPEIHALSSLTTEIIQFPGIMFNLVCFGWLYVSAHHTMNLLRQFKEMAKVEQFHTFCRILGYCLFFSTLVTIGKGTALILQYDDIWWRVWWMWDVAWEAIFYLTTVASLYVWMPRRGINMGPTEEMLRYHHPPEPSQE